MTPDELEKEAERIHDDFLGRKLTKGQAACLLVRMYQMGRAVHDSAIEKAAIVAEAHRIDGNAVTTGVIVKLMAESIRALKIGDGK